MLPRRGVTRRSGLVDATTITRYDPGLLYHDIARIYVGGACRRKVPVTSCVLCLCVDCNKKIQLTCWLSTNLRHSGGSCG